MFVVSWHLTQFVAACVPSRSPQSRVIVDLSSGSLGLHEAGPKAGLEAGA